MVRIGLGSRKIRGERRCVTPENNAFENAFDVIGVKQDDLVGLVCGVCPRIKSLLDSIQGLIF